jgi:hypothetical protein
VSGQNVKAALKEIDGGKNPMPSRRHSTDWCFIASNGRHYPPKYVLARAYFYKTGKQLKGFKASTYTRNPLIGFGTVKKCQQVPNCQTHIVSY